MTEATILEPMAIVLVGQVPDLGFSLLVSFLLSFKDSFQLWSSTVSVKWSVCRFLLRIQLTQDVFSNLWGGCVSRLTGFLASVVLSEQRRDR